MRNILSQKYMFGIAAFLITFIIGLLIIRQYGPQAEASATADTPPAASAALLEIQRIAPTYDAWKAEEEKWNKAKQIITEVYGCTIAADRSAIDCSFPQG
jgi:hypothetical protein